jgi:hypothetical protein
MSEKEIKDMADIFDAVEKIAFSIPAPNIYTPQLVSMAMIGRDRLRQIERKL